MAQPSVVGAPPFAPRALRLARRARASIEASLLPGMICLTLAAGFLKRRPAGSVKAGTTKGGKPGLIDNRRFEAKEECRRKVVRPRDVFKQYKRCGQATKGARWMPWR